MKRFVWPEQQATGISMATYEDDQNKTAIMVINGVHTAVSATQLKFRSPIGSVYTFTATYRHSFKGQHLDYRKGVSYALDPALRTALLALGAPMVIA